MVTVKAKTTFTPGKLKAKVRSANIKTIGHAGAAIRLVARRSIKKSKKNAPAGSPPNTRKGRIKNAIKYAVASDGQSVVIGPDYAVAADSGTAHEHGGRYRNETYDRRPFMGPALSKTKDRLPAMWAGSVKG
jgi:hypothetical protein